jgi:hypothetical protein
VAALPLAVELRGGRLQARLRTGPDGRAAVRVDDVGRFDTPEKAITARVDWGALSGGGAAPAWAIAMPDVAVATTALKKTRETTRVIVRVSEQIMISEAGGDPRAVPEPPVSTAIMKALEAAGLRPVDPRLLDARLTDPAAAGEDELRAKAAGLADVLIVGSATSRESSKYGAVTVWHRARADLHVVDLGTGQVAATISGEARGTRPGQPDVAGRSALEALSEKLGPTVGPTVLGGLGL